NATRTVRSSAGQTMPFLRAELRRISNEVFDVEQMARGILWHHWAKRTALEQTEFIRLFTDLLERLYVAHIRQLRWVIVVPAGEVVDTSYATVTWKLNTLGSVGVIEYRLRRRAGRWKIYDVMLNGRSFVSSCREEFDERIHASSYSAFVRELPRRDHAGFVGPGSTLTAAVAQ
ncbi:MAG: MlaC/ttg2D family ABC transporter substrate-binding protein, partial [Actinomycetota bacterium]